MARYIDVGLVDDHNEALNFYYKLIARKKIPFDGLCLVHFDSHPDLALPESIPVSKVSKLVEVNSYIYVIVSTTSPFKW